MSAHARGHEDVRCDSQAYDPSPPCLATVTARIGAHIRSSKPSPRPSSSPPACPSIFPSFLFPPYSTMPHTNIHTHVPGNGKGGGRGRWRARQNGKGGKGTALSSPSMRSWPEWKAGRRASISLCRIVNRVAVAVRGGTGGQRSMDFPWRLPVGSRPQRTSVSHRSTVQSQNGLAT